MICQQRGRLLALLFCISWFVWLSSENLDVQNPSLFESVPEQEMMKYFSEIALETMEEMRKNNTIQIRTRDPNRYCRGVEAKRKLNAGNILFSAVSPLSALEIHTIDRELVEVMTADFPHFMFEDWEILMIFLIRQTANPTSYPMTVIHIGDKMFDCTVPASPLSWLDHEIEKIRPSPVYNMLLADKYADILRFQEIDAEVFSKRRDFFPKIIFSQEVWLSFSSLVFQTSLRFDGVLYWIPFSQIFGIMSPGNVRLLIDYSSFKIHYVATKTIAKGEEIGFDLDEMVPAYDSNYEISENRTNLSLFPRLCFLP